jgi:hypothetical protein
MSKRPPLAVLLPENELVLRCVLRSIIAAHPIDGESEATRLNDAIAALTGRPRLPERKDRDELLGLIAFEYSVAKINNTSEISLASIADKLVSFYPNTADLSEKESISRDLQRKFAAFRKQLLDRYGYDAEWDDSALLRSVRIIMNELEKAGIPVDRSFLPPGYRHDGARTESKSDAIKKDM